MKTFAVAASLFLFLTNAFGFTIGATKAHIENHSLLKAIEGSTLVVVGKVIGMEYENRNVDPVGYPKQVTTDVTVLVEHLIKGTPNAGKNESEIHGSRGKDYRSQNRRAY